MSRFQKIIKASFLALLLFSLLTTNVNPSAYAEDAPPADQNKPYEQVMKDLPSVAPDEAKNSEDLIKDVAKLANKTHRLFAPLINVFAFHIGNFLGTDYIYQGAMGQMLHRIWVISRNLVNIAFVFLLLWMALKEIFFVGQDTDLKKSLITFVLLMIAVNFSWLGTKVVLDAANVVTHAVFAIPSGITGDTNSEAANAQTKKTLDKASGSSSNTQCDVNSDPTKPISGSCYPTVVIAPADLGNSNPLYWEDHEGEDDNCAKVRKSYGGSPGADACAAYKADGTRNELAGNGECAIDNSKLQGRTSICVENLNLINYDQNTAVIYLTYGMARIQNLVSTSGNQSASQLAVSVLLSLAIQIAYTVSLMALFIALVIRMAMLWLFVAFSPFIVLLWWGGFEDKKLGDFEFGVNGFIKWAFVAAKVGAVFVVSFIMISAGQSMGEIKTALIEKSGFVYQIPAVSTLFGSIGTLQNFIWLLICLVVLWMGVFAILKDMPIVNVVTDKINEYGTAVGKLVGKSPYWAPILPLGKGGQRVSAESIVQQVDLRKRMEAYRGKDFAHSEQAIRELNATAREVDFNSIASLLDKGHLQTPDVRMISSKYNFSSPQEMYRMIKTHEKEVLAAFNQSNNSDGRGKRLLAALKDAEHSFERESASRQVPPAPATPPAGTPSAQAPDGTPPTTPPPHNPTSSTPPGRND